MQPFRADRRRLIAGTMATGLLSSVCAAAAAGPKSVSPIPKTRIIKSRSGHYIRDASLDLTGYLLPAKDIKIGTFAFDYFGFGGPDDFESFEKKGQTIPTWTPFMAVFEDLSSAEKQGEHGPYRANSLRVFCSHYIISREVIEFTGHDRQVGYVRFRGRANTVFLAGQLDPDGALDGAYDAAMTGDLFVGGTAFRNIHFSYWAGD